MSKMNVELLRAIANKLRRMRHKKHFDMDVIIKKNECGTAACIAGYALLMSGYKRNKNDDLISPGGRKVSDELQTAKRLLGLNYHQGERLFHATRWPDRFFYVPESHQCQYNDPKVAASRIEYFIETKGNE